MFSRWTLSTSHYTKALAKSQSPDVDGALLLVGESPVFGELLGRLCGDARWGGEARREEEDDDCIDAKRLVIRSSEDRFNLTHSDRRRSNCSLLCWRVDL